MIKLMEYMAMAKPTVVFDLPEHRVTLQDAGLYATSNNELDFAKKISLLIDDPIRRKKMGEIGLSRVRNELAWSHQEIHLLAAYDILFSNSTKRFS
jgi:glycosyltransferase involved in cell wall biosynthesis